jgi:hypothetical protein
MGSTYGVGKKSSALYSNGYAAAAKYINASPSNIGSKFPSILTPLTI